MVIPEVRLDPRKLAKFLVFCCAACPCLASLAIVKDYTGRIIPSGRCARLYEARYPYGSQQNRHPGRPAAQSQEYLPGNSAEHSDRDYGPIRLGQVLTRLRHTLRRGPAPLRRVALGLRSTVPRSDGAP